MIAYNIDRKKYLGQTWEVISKIGKILSQKRATRKLVRKGRKSGLPTLIMLIINLLQLISINNFDLSSNQVLIFADPFIIN